VRDGGPDDDHTAATMLGDDRGDMFHCRPRPRGPRRVPALGGHDPTGSWVLIVVADPDSEIQSSDISDDI
jgi:hypothetical protein